MERAWLAEQREGMEAADVQKATVKQMIQAAVLVDGAPQFLVSARWWLQFSECAPSPPPFGPAHLGSRVGSGELLLCGSHAG